MAEGTQMIDPALLDLDQLPATALAGVISPSNMAKINDNDNDAATRYDRLQHIIESEVQLFLGGNPNSDYVDAALGTFIGVSNRLLAHLKKLGVAPVHSEDDITMQDGPVDDQAALPLVNQSALPLVTQSALPLVNQSGQAAHANVSNGDFDFDSVLPEATLAREWKEPYDSLWMSKLGVPPTKLADFDSEWLCRYKMEDIIRFGAIVAGDEFAVRLLNVWGVNEWRFAKVVHVGLITPGEPHSKWWPHIAMLTTQGGQELTAAVPYKTPDDIIAAIEGFFGGSASESGYLGVHVSRGGHDMGTIRGVRLTYALWQKTVDEWAAKNGVHWRKRGANAKAGSPAITRRGGKA